ncbi:MAG: HPr family phosphocarrier protein [Rickettsiales bacterium]
MSSRPSLEAVIQNIKGLHARASAKFVKTVALHNASVWVTRVVQNPADYDPEKDGPVSGGSLLGLMMLAADMGTTLKLEAEGPQAQEALVSLKTLIDHKFGEEE